MSNAELARRLEQLADLSELNGDNPFRVRAYRNAARAVIDNPEQIEDLLAAGADLTTIPAIGKETAEKLTTMVNSGELPQLDELAEKVPLGLVEVTRVKGIGPKMALAAWRELGITNVDELEKAAQEGRLAELPGFGPKRQKTIIGNIAAHRRNVARARLGDIDPMITPLLARLRGVPGVERVEVAGSYRRRRDTVGDVDIVACADDPAAAAAITTAFTTYPEVEAVLGSGDTRSTVRLANGIEVDLRVVDSTSFGAALLYFTGSKAHGVALRQLALDHGWHLNEYGLFEGADDDKAGSGPVATGKRLAGADEAGIYAKLGLAFELREARGEIAAAQKNELPQLLKMADIRGDLHMHSRWSDGRNTISEMIDACVERGYSYMAITDHSQALAMTGGLDEEKLARQWQELDTILEDRDDITVLRGLEIDILKDGTLDLSDEWLERLDIVLVSVHSHFDLAPAEQTARVVKAVSHPHTNILCHPTGRVLGEREGYQLDLSEVFAACAANDVAVELNASYQRLDLSDVNVLAARKRGLTISIGTDAHDFRELDGMRFGVEQARRAWAGKEAVLNTRTVKQLKRFLAKA